VLLRDAEKRKNIHGLKIGRHVDPITHLLFADDSLLLGLWLLWPNFFGARSVLKMSLDISSQGASSIKKVLA
jgi:hypothetical protein